MSLANSNDIPSSNALCVGTTLSNITDEEKSGQTSNSSKDTNITTATASTDSSRRRMCQNFLLIWMDGNIDESHEDCQNTLTELRKVVNDINLFTNPDECVDFLSEVDGQKAFMIVAGTIGQQIVPLIHEMPQLHAVYIFCDNKSRHEQWSKVWGKVKGVNTQITSIYEALEKDVKQCNQDSIALSFVPMYEGTTNQNLDQLDPSFMYTQIFKEILLFEMEYRRQSIEEFCTYCRNNNYGSVKGINQFKDEYQSHLAIWWYTCPSFIFSLLNQALRTLEADTIITMGFFIHDLHRQIEQLHQKQVSSYHEKSFIVYRGQSLLEADFEKLSKTKGGLMSFNNFLSTSRNREVSLGFAEGALGETNTVGILFVMAIDTSISSIPFAAIDEVSYFKTEEEEILFSMHTVFRIGEIKKLDNNNRLYQVELTLTGDDDQQLRMLTKLIQKEGGGFGWQRLGTVLIKIGQFNKAEELYTVLLEQTSDKAMKATYYGQLLYIKHNQGDYEKALWYYEKGLKIQEEILQPDDRTLATSYNNIGLVYTNMGEYSKALSSYEKTRKIFEETLPPNHPDLATSYNNIGGVYINMKEYSKALLLYEKALEIREKTLPPNHPDMATSYNNIGAVYDNMGEYSRALAFYDKALEIRGKTLPPNHPSFAISYSNISRVYGKMGGVYYNMGEYSKALLFYDKALEIQEKTLPPNHPELATSYNNIGAVYKNRGEYSKALSVCDKALEIREKTFPLDHPNLATCYDNIGEVYKEMGEYSRALSFYEKALKIREKTLPPDHPVLATSYNNIAFACDNMGEYWKALSCLERALDIRQRSLPPNHPDTQNVRVGIESVKQKLYIFLDE